MYAVAETVYTAELQLPVPALISVILINLIADHMITSVNSMIWYSWCHIIMMSYTLHTQWYLSTCQAENTEIPLFWSLRHHSSKPPPPTARIPAHLSSAQQDESQENNAKSILAIFTLNSGIQNTGVWREYRRLRGNTGDLTGMWEQS